MSNTKNDSGYVQQMYNPVSTYLTMSNIIHASFAMQI